MAFETSGSEAQSTDENRSKPAAAGWTPEVAMNVKGVAQARVSPDGRQVVFAVREAVMTEETSEYVSHLYLANSDGSDCFPLTFGATSSSDPQWSPDGKFLAFLSRRGAKNNEKNNLYVLRVAGGEAEPLTEVKADIEAFAWSPDGAHIALVMPDPLTDEEEKRNKGKDDWHWVDEDIKMQRLHVLTVQQDGEGKRELRAITPASLNVWTAGGFDWSPDGKSIAFTHTKSPSADDWLTSAISVVTVAGGEIRALLNGNGYHAQPSYSPDGAQIAFTISNAPARWLNNNSICCVPAEGGTFRPLASTPDVAPSIIGWSTDSRRVFCQEAHGTRLNVYALDDEGKTVTELNLGDGLVSEVALNATGTHFGFVRQTLDSPVEAFAAPVTSLEFKQVSHVNASLPDAPIGKTEIIRWKSRDGLEIEGMLTYPVDYQPGTRVPLLLVIHGGPASVFQENFIGSPMLYPIATFASRGYAVLRANPRGSSGYGKAFRFANIRDWGGGDYEDLMRGVDHVIGMGVGDAERLGVMGWSYGGFMTSWVITHTNRFKAASVGAAVTNLVSFTGTADIPGFLPDYFEAQFWDDLEIYQAHSPMHSVKGVTTPSLIQHGDADVRVPISQGYELYNALKSQHVPVRMLVLPRQPHTPNEPRMQLKIMQTNADWFDTYLKTA